MDVGGWLRGLGLGQYEEQFRDNKIDADLLPRLTVDDLKDIGVSVVGDRRRLLDAIAVIAGAGPASPTKSAPSKGLQASAERRPITVMFCDLVGSTSLAAKLDAEDWRNLVNAYLDEASAAVTDFGGHVLKKLGDGLMALFGYPQAQENDAERAVRAALAIQRALADLNARNAAKGAPELSARIGIESGPVVVEASGEVFGDAPNIAARVQAEAEPGSVLITLNVQRQVAGLFVAEEQSARELKGVSQPVQLFRIVRASGGGRRGGARTLTPFVGREEELGLLTRRWERARAGEGQLVLVVGEPGLGKSRLIEEFHSQLAETPHTWSEWSASQLLQNTPLHPIAEWGRLRFGADAPAEQRLADLEGTLRLTGLDPAEHAPLLAPLVDIPLPPDRATNLPPEELRRRQLAAMTAWVLAGARSQPLVLAFEDLHWADPTSLDLLRAFADRGAQAPLLVLATTRPEFRAPWSLRSHHSLISLSPLDRAGVARMVGEISARHALSKELIEGVNERTGGVPLFVEEVTRLLVERGAQGGVQAIPPTLQQSLAARLDRLGPAREVAQIGAVLGRDFVYALLRDRRPTSTSRALQASLDRLADADLLFVEGAAAEANYRFKHALIQDAAYDSLLKSRRQALHRRAAELRCASANARARSRSPIISPKPASTISPSNGGARPGDQALAPLGVPGGDRPSRQGDRHGGQGGKRDGAPHDWRGSRCWSATDAVTRRLRQRANCSARLCSARNDRSLHKSPGVCGWRNRHVRSIRCRVWLVGGKPHSGRPAGHEGARRGVPQRRFGETRFVRGLYRSPDGRIDTLVRRRICGSARLFGTGAHVAQPRAGRRSSLSLRPGPRNCGDGLSRDCIVADGRRRACGVSRSRRRGPNF